MFEHQWYAGVWQERTRPRKVRRRTKVMGLSRDNIKDIWEQVTDPPLWGNPQSVEGAVDLLEVGTFMAGQPIRVGHQRLLERLSRPMSVVVRVQS